MGYWPKLNAETRADYPFPDDYPFHEGDGGGGGGGSSDGGGSSSDGGGSSSDGGGSSSDGGGGSSDGGGGSSDGGGGGGGGGGASSIEQPYYPVLLPLPDSGHAGNEPDPLDYIGLGNWEMLIGDIRSKGAEPDRGITAYEGGRFFRQMRRGRASMRQWLDLPSNVRYDVDHGRAILRTEYWYILVSLATSNSGVAMTVEFYDEQGEVISEITSDYSGVADDWTLKRDEFEIPKHTRMISVAPLTQLINPYGDHELRYDAISVYVDKVEY